MIIEVKLFAIAKEIVGAEMAPVEVPAHATVADLRAALISQYPALDDVMRNTMIAVNACYADDDARLPDSAEVACIPPVSGG